MRPENWREVGFGNAYTRILKLSEQIRECRVLKQRMRVPQIHICIRGVAWVESATRVAYAHKHGIESLIDGFDVRRSCMNLGCVEVSHLVLVPASTILNEEQRRRQRAGTRNSEYSKKRRIVPRRVVGEIRRRAEEGRSLFDLFKKYGATVYNIANGYTYRDDDLPRPERGPIGHYLRPRPIDATKRGTG